MPQGQPSFLQSSVPEERSRTSRAQHGSGTGVAQAEQGVLAEISSRTSRVRGAQPGTTKAARSSRSCKHGYDRSLSRRETESNRCSYSSCKHGFDTGALDARFRGDPALLEVAAAS